MTKTTNQRRTAASILDDVRKQLTSARLELAGAQQKANALQVKVNTILAILADAEKSGEAE